MAYAGAPGGIGLSPDDLRRGPETKALRFTAIGGRWFVVRDGIAAGLDDATLTAAASVPGGRLVSAARITAYDAYWYPHGDARPLPVLRLIYDDPAATWLHIDPRRRHADPARPLGLNRWLFDAHRLDLPGLTRPPAVNRAMDPQQPRRRHRRDRSAASPALDRTLNLQHMRDAAIGPVSAVAEVFRLLGDPTRLRIALTCRAHRGGDR